MNTEEFWEKYIEKLNENSIPTKSKRWYVKRVEDYIKAHCNIRLAQHSESTVKKYLEKLGRNYRLTDWQFKQAVEALKILFVDILHASWAESFSWSDLVDSATELPVSHPTIARNYESGNSNTKNGESRNLSTSTDPRCNEVRKKFPEHFNKLITIIRIKNYSIRTEQAYENWLARYIAFHSMKDPAELESHAIVVFL